MRIAAALLVLALAGCSAGAPEPADTLSGTVNVFAAASLTASFEEIADAFTEENPAVDVVFNFGGSSSLATQIVEGAPADVFAAASPATMTTVAEAQLTERSPVDFASNVLEIAVAPGNPGSIAALSDFANPDRLIALCAVEVPCGAASAKLFETAGITPSVDTYEQDVKAVLTKVSLGEVDAGLVYVTDVLEAGVEGGVEGIEVDSPAVQYPILTLTDNVAARAFQLFVLSPEGQDILKAAGFGAP